MINGARNLVITCPPKFLHSLNLSRRKVKVPTGLDQNFAPFTERKVRFANSFLPISALFHSPYLQPATGIILDDLKEIEAFTRQDLVIPIFYTSTDPDLYDVLVMNQ